MRTLLRRRNLLALAVIVAFALVVAPSASAGAISTVVQVGETAGSISPSTVTGAAGDTLQVHNAGTHAGSYGEYITIENGTGTASLGGYPCTNSGICMIVDGSTETLTILTPGTFWIVRESFNTGTTTIGTLTVSAPAPAVDPVTAVPGALDCASSNWNFGVVDYTQGGFGDQILVTWGMPKVCSGGVASFVLRQTTPDGASTNVPVALCTPDLVVKPGSSDALWSCALKVAAVPANTLEFQVVATTTGGLQASSRSVQWVRDAAPNADVAGPGAGACSGRISPTGSGAALGSSPNLICFIVQLVIQTEYASNGNQALTDKQARELLNIGVAFSDTQSARSGRAAKAKWVSIGKKTMKIKKAGKLRVSLPLSKKGVALLRKGPLKVRVTYTLTRGTATRTIVQYATLPRIAS
ncbi:MAG: hypothetical protein WCN97_01685 [Thermoleophilia bacterium]